MCIYQQEEHFTQGPSKINVLMQKCTKVPQQLIKKHRLKRIFRSLKTRVRCETSTINGGGGPEKIRKGAEKEEGYLYIFILLVNIASI